MITHIDLGHVLRRNVCDLYSNLVTRPTGAAVRSGIEQQLSEGGGRIVTVIDFANVSLLDFSCADEIVAKLVLKYCSSDAGIEAYFLFRGVSESHLDAIDSVLERHRIAIVVQYGNGEAALTGWITDDERRAWYEVHARKRIRATDFSTLGGADVADLSEVLNTLHSRRLLIRLEDEYVSLGELIA